MSTENDNRLLVMVVFHGKKTPGPFWLCKLAILLHFWGCQMLTGDFHPPVRSGEVRFRTPHWLRWRRYTTRVFLFRRFFFFRKLIGRPAKQFFMGSFCLHMLKMLHLAIEHIPFGSKTWQWETSGAYLGPFNKNIIYKMGYTCPLP